MTRITAGTRRLGALARRFGTWLGGQFIDDIRRGYLAGMETLFGPPF
jgi:hypothetical protein